MKRFILSLIIMIMLFSCSSSTEPKEDNYNATITYTETGSYWDIDIPAYSTVSIEFSVHAEYDGIYLYSVDASNMTWCCGSVRNISFDAGNIPEKIKVEIIGE
jgi:hypothetical protein